MANEWIGVIHTTAPKYLSGAADNTIRKRLILSLLKQKGRIKFNENSYQCNWDVEFKEQPVEAYGDGGTLNFSRHDLYRQLNVDWRGYKATDLMTEKERLMNDGALTLLVSVNEVFESCLSAYMPSPGCSLPSIKKTSLLLLTTIPAFMTGAFEYPL